MININGDTKIIGFLGATYKISKMYAMYNDAFEALKLNYVYIPFIVTDLQKAVGGLRNLGIHAAGVTIPYKIEIIKYLDELDDNAKKIGAVNVVLNNNGKLIGGNTDGLGVVKAIKETVSIRNKRIILLGAGGAARAIAFALKDEGGKLVILNRTIELANELALSVGCNYGDLTKTEAQLKDANILINSTSVGMAPNVNQSLINRSKMHKRLTVMDLVTNPRETRLLKEAKDEGCKIVYGERMLFWQAVLKFKLFTGVEAPVEVMEKALC